MKARYSLFWFATARTAALGLALGAAVSGAMAQSETVWFQRAFGVNSTDLEWKWVAALDSGYVAAVAQERDTHNQILVQCWNPDGSVRFIYRYPDSQSHNDVPAGIVADNANGEFVVLGSTDQGDPNGFRKTLLVRLSTSGTAVDQALIDVHPGSTVEEDPGNLKIDGDDLTFSVDADTVAHVVRVNDLLNVQWNTTIDSPIAQDTIDHLAVDGANVLAAGHKGQVENFACLLDSLTGTVRWAEDLPVDETVSSVDAENGRYLVLTQNITFGDLHAYATNADRSVTGSRVFSGGYLQPGDLVHDAALDCVYVATQESTPAELVLWKWNLTDDTVVEDRLENLAGPGRDHFVRSDDQGNVIVLSSTTLGGGNVNLAAWCWDKDMKRMWHEELGGTGSTDDLPNAHTADSSGRYYAVGESTDTSSQARQALIWRVRQFFKTWPEDVTTRLGRHAGGNLASLQDTDDDPYVVCKFVTPNLQVHPINIEFEGALPVGNLLPGETELSLTVTAKTNTSGLLAGVEFYDWQSQSWVDEYVESGLGSSAYLKVTAHATGNLSRLIDGPDHRVKGRIRVKQFGPTSKLLYCVYIDEVRWELKG